MGVSLFLRTKNSIALNETGKLAAEYAQKALEQADEMYQRVRDFDRSQHTILIGSCIPLPLPDLMNALAMHYPDATIGTETKKNAILLDGLYHNTYSLIVLPYKPDDHELTAVHYCSETLMFYLPKNHKYAKRKALHFHEMDGENMLVYHNTGS